MKTTLMTIRQRPIRGATRGLAVLLALMALSHPAHASIFKGEALDKLADLLTWIVLVVAPVVGIAVFWLVHILPEKIAEKRRHPQAKAIQCLCLLSLVFGGLLWPLAWLWAYSKPVLYRLAYGTDQETHGHEASDTSTATPDDLQELERMRRKVAELETKLAGPSPSPETKA